MTSFSSNIASKNKVFNVHKLFLFAGFEVVCQFAIKVSNHLNKCLECLSTPAFLSLIVNRLLF